MKTNIVNAMFGLLMHSQKLIMSLTTLSLAMMLAACSGGGGGGGTASPAPISTVSGVAATGAILSGTVYLKDSSNPVKELSKAIGADGTFSFDVTGMTKPFLLKATGSANGNSHTLYSLENGTGTANINPMSHLVVVHASGGADLAALYNDATASALQNVAAHLPAALQEIQAKLQPLLQAYGIVNVNPIADAYTANHQGLDGMLDAVRIDVSNGTVTITNKTTNAVIFTAPTNNIQSGTVMTGNISPQTAPSAPTGVTASASSGQVSISWNAVAGATSYNVYWSTSAGVTKSGTKITGAASPYVHTGLINGTTYYYAVTAVNSGGESDITAEVSATPNNTSLSAPTNLKAIAGDGKVTVSWDPVQGATSYNIYWSTSSGVTKNNDKIINAINGGNIINMTNGTTYYLVVTASSSSTESSASNEVSVIPNSYETSAPTYFIVIAGDNRATVIWQLVKGATSYNIYWSTSSGVTKTNKKIANVTNGGKLSMANGTTYYLAVTAVSSSGESDISNEVSVTPNYVSALPDIRGVWLTKLDLGIYCSPDNTPFSNSGVYFAKIEQIGNDVGIGIFDNSKPPKLKFIKYCTRELNECYFLGGNNENQDVVYVQYPGSLTIENTQLTKLTGLDKFEVSGNGETCKVELKMNMAKLSQIDVNTQPVNDYTLPPYSPPSSTQFPWLPISNNAYSYCKFGHGAGCW